MNRKNIDTATDEDISYWKSMDFSNAKRANEIPIIKALQNNPQARAMYAPRKKTITLRIDEDILALLKKGGRGYQNRLNNMLRELLKENLNQ
ncbi:MAG: BrnA antitoxin family protein [Cardiobacteriaceae bacterium]|nr:BrnA antitoxin family protein [Cardiobacteriaceae bacterium]